MNCRELQVDFVIPAGFRAHQWIRHEILPNIGVSGDRISKWEASDPQDRFCSFIIQKTTNPDINVTLLFKVEIFPIFQSVHFATPIYTIYCEKTLLG